MTLKAVHLTSDVYLACTSHALSTEGEEIIGLLLGDLHDSNSNGNPSREMFVESVVILQRSDRQANRVEISPLQLASASQEAEALSVKLGKKIRVLGWYHSHPHITVHPSHVDVHTQASYQGMDADFIGLIFSVFQNEGNPNFASASMICFQSHELDGSVTSKEIPIHITSQKSEHCLQALTGIPRNLFSEIEAENSLNNLSNQRFSDAVLMSHNSAVFMQGLCRLVECCQMPCISAIHAYEHALKCKVLELEQLKRDMLNFT